MVYIIGWALDYFVVAFWYMKYRIKSLVLLPLFFIGMIIVIRYSGTDTFGVYEAILRAILQGKNSFWAFSIEPGFIFLSKIFLGLTGSEILALRGIGLVFTLLLLAYWRQADYTELRYLLFYFVPGFIYQYGMNAVRAGLGLAILLLAWQALRRRKWKRFAILALVGLSIHYSMLLPLGLLLFPELKLKNWRVLFMACLVGMAFVLLVVARLDYFEAKLNLYSHYAPPSILSGFVPLGLVVLVWLSFSLSPVSNRSRVNTFLIVALAIAFKILALFSYAGLRLLELMAFVAPLAFISEYDRMHRAPGKVFWLGLTLAGMIGAVAMYQNFLADYNGRMTGSLTPFLPYRTIFNYKP